MPISDRHAHAPRAKGLDEHGRETLIELELADRQYSDQEWAELKRRVAAAEARGDRVVGPAVQKAFDEYLRVCRAHGIPTGRGTPRHLQPGAEFDFYF